MVVATLLFVTVTAAANPPAEVSADEAGLTEKTPINRGSGESSGQAGGSGLFDWESYLLPGGLLLVVWGGAHWLKRIQGRARTDVAGILEVVATTPLSGHSRLHIVRLGERILLVGDSPAGLSRLAELDDRTEIDHLLGQSAQAGEISDEVSRPTGRSWMRAAGALLLLACAPIASAQSPHASRTVSRFEPVDVDRYLESQRLPGSGQTFRRENGPWGHASGHLPHSQRERGSREFGYEAIPSAAMESVNRPGPQSVSGNSSPVKRVSWSVTAEETEDEATTGPGDSVSLLSPDDLQVTLKLAVLIGVMSLAPAILMMTTCYVRIIVVLNLLRQAIGIPQFPPTQVLTALSLFLTAVVMWPVWERAYHEGIRPYLASEYATPAERQAAFDAAITRTWEPVRRFMSSQIEADGNAAAIDLFLEYDSATKDRSSTSPQFYEEVPTRVLLPSYLLSELKTAFLIGFRIYLPFVVIDLLTAAVVTAFGLTTVPPNVVALPVKLLLFVAIDGWFLTIETLLRSVAIAAV